MENNKVKIGQHFIKLLLLYILLLLVFLTLYVVSVLVSDYKLDKDKYSVELAKMEDESKSVLDSMLNSALSITQIESTILFPSVIHIFSCYLEES